MADSAWGRLNFHVISFVSTLMSSIHAIRAKKWETNPFIAEWFANAVLYCQTPEGKKAFGAWWVPSSYVFRVPIIPTG
jgi:hypothetical protein